MPNTEQTGFVPRSELREQNAKGHPARRKKAPAQRRQNHERNQHKNRTEKASQHALKTTMVVTLIIAASKLLGFVREMVMAAYFGRGVESDAFVTAYGIFSIMTLLFSAGIASTFIPIYTKTRLKEGQSAADWYASRVVTLYFVAGLIGSALAYIFAPAICSLIYRADVGVELTIQLTRMMYPSLAFYAVTGVLCNLLNAREKFIPEQLLGFVLSACLISAMVAFKDIRMVGMAVSVTGVMQLVILLPFLRGQIRFQPHLTVRDPKIQRTFLLAVPALISMAFDEINHQIDRMIGSSLGVGVVTALSKSYSLVTTALGILIVPITTITFSRLSRIVAKRKKNDFCQAVRESIEIIALITLPVMAMAIVMQKDIIAVAFQRGAFKAEDTAFTAPVFACYIAGLFFFGLRNFLSRVFYSLQDTRTPMRVGIVSVCINIGLNLTLSRVIGAMGLTLATTTAALAGATLQLILLHKKMGNMGLGSVIGQLFKIILSLAIATAGMIFVLSLCPVHSGETLNGILRLGIGAISFLAVYLGATLACGVRSTKRLYHMITGR